MANALDHNRKGDRIASLWGLVEKITNELRSDPRIIAVWVFGSLARGEADEFSDLDMAALVEEDKFQEFVRESREEKWMAKLEADASTDKWGDNIFARDICITVNYLTPDDDLEVRVLRYPLWWREGRSLMQPEGDVDQRARASYKKIYLDDQRCNRSLSRCPST